MHNKSLADMQAEIVKLRNAAQLPGIDAAERKIYLDAIATIEKRIASMPAATQPEFRPQTGGTFPPPANRHPQGTPEPPVPKAPRATKSSPSGVGGAARITASAASGARTVEIDWGNNRRDILTEGDARSRFTTALRDLCHSRMARLKRFESIPQYITFDRACAYYRALTIFWGGPPTPAQLQIVTLSTDRRTIFQLIQQHTAETEPA